MIKELIKLATHLDSKGLAKEADYLDAVIKRLAGMDLVVGPLKTPVGDVTYFMALQGEHNGSIMATDDAGSTWMLGQGNSWADLSGPQPASQRKLDGGAAEIRETGHPCLPGDKNADCAKSSVMD